MTEVCEPGWALYLQWGGGGGEGGGNRGLEEEQGGGESTREEWLCTEDQWDLLHPAGPEYSGH